MAAALVGLRRLNIFRVMARHPEATCLILAGIVTLISRNSHSLTGQVTSLPPFPKRFFPANSPVADFHYGSLQPLSKLIDEAEVLFVFYYAPWDAQSMEARWEFDKASKVLGSQVKFVAVNCWYNNGQCKGIHNFYSFPILFVYHSHLNGFLYQGLLTADHMVSFLQKLIYPFEYVTCARSIKELSAVTDNLLLSFFDFNSSPQPPGFVQFYYAAMRMIASDPYHPVKFAVISNPDLAKDYGLVNSSSLVMIRSLNETLKYPVSYNITASYIVEWINNFKQQPVVQWVIPSGKKSLSFSTQLARGPAVIMFLPNNPLDENNQYYSMLRELALDYYNCDKTSAIYDIIKDRIDLRKFAIEKENNLTSNCIAYFKQKNEVHKFDKKCCLSVVIDDQTIHSKSHNVCDVCLNRYSTQRYEHCHAIPTSSLNLQGLPKKPTTFTCQETMLNYDVNQRLSMCCSERFENGIKNIEEQKNTQKTRRPTDPVTANFQERRLAKQCNVWRFKKHHSSSNIDSQIVKQPHIFSDDFTGLGCSTNKTVYFYVIDPTYHSEFAKRLSLPPDKNRMAVVLFDKKQEAQYYMNGAISKVNLVNFVRNFTVNTLTRSLRSSGPTTQCAPSEEDMCITEVTTKTFRNVVMNQEKDVVVLFFTPWCGFCAGLAHVYLMLARYFRDAKSIVFTRLNTDVNDLPWEFTVTTYPTILFFPARRKAESVAFPENKEITLPNLINFILRHATKSLKLRAALTICSHHCILKNKEKSIKTIQSLHNEIRQLKIRIPRIQHSLDDLRVLLHSTSVIKDLGSVDGADGREDTRQQRLENDADTLQKYLQTLKRRLTRKEIQSHNAKVLHRLLSESKGNLDKHKLGKIIAQHEKIAQQLNSEENEKET